MSLGTDQFASQNPYQPPLVAVEKRPSSLRYSIGSIFAAILIVTLAATSTYFGYEAYRLTIEYPGLNDPSPNVDGYWPAVVNLFCTVIAAISGLLAIIIGMIWGYCSHSRRTRLRTTQNAEATLSEAGTA
jgi:ABC-type Fe3+ transport system permease subunit